MVRSNLLLKRSSDQRSEVWIPVDVSLDEKDFTLRISHPRKVIFTLDGGNLIASGRVALIKRNGGERNKQNCFQVTLTSSNDCNIFNFSAPTHEAMEAWVAILSGDIDSIAMFEPIVNASISPTRHKDLALSQFYGADCDQYENQRERNDLVGRQMRLNMTAITLVIIVASKCRSDLVIFQCIDEQWRPTLSIIITITLLGIIHSIPGTSKTAPASVQKDSCQEERLEDSISVRSAFPQGDVWEKHHVIYNGSSKCLTVRHLAAGETNSNCRLSVFTLDANQIIAEGLVVFAKSQPHSFTDKGNPPAHILVVTVTSPTCASRMC